jgi:hypothetical protein
MAGRQPEALDAPDSFDPANLRLAPDFEAVSIKRALTTIPVRKPGKQEFLRVHPEEEYRLETGLIELKEDREHYLVHPAMRAELVEDMVSVRLYLAVSRGGAVFFWPVRLPGPDGRRNPWHESAERAAQLAAKDWVRISANMAAGSYDTFIATATLAEPEWPELSMNELLKLAFADRFITSIDHPIVKRLRGLA